MYTFLEGFPRAWRSKSVLSRKENVTVRNALDLGELTLQKIAI